jgi:16S rRNA U516 pseudouridylate synthase RsuA-like enzyme
MGKNPKSTRYIPFRPSAGQEKQLRRLSKQTGLSVSDLVRLCLDRDLD